ncbi:MAG: GNAT family N-acetyltransferase [Dehalococcoidia bacterium]
MDVFEPIRVRDDVWLRPWRDEDAPALAGHANNRNVSRNLRDHFPYPYTDADAREFLARRVSQAIPENLAIEAGGGAAGGIALRSGQDVNRGTAEIGYWLAEPHWGRGIMTEAARAITAYGIERLSLRRIEAGVFERNLASARVLEKAGYVLEGRLRRAVIKDGEVMDTLVYAYVRP